MTDSINHNDFLKKLQDGLTLVDFFATWCGPCKLQAPILEGLAYNMGDKLKIEKVDVDRNQALAGEFAIQSIPTMILFKDGEIVERISGLHTKDQLSELITPHI